MPVVYHQGPTGNGNPLIVAAKKPKKRKIDVVDLAGLPHNGQGRPELQFPDPITGELIGGQVAMMRMALRYPHVVAPWARRGGKSKARQFVTQNEATITPGEYYAGICFPDHTTAAKIADNFRKSWGPMVKNHKINDKDQDRWIELQPLVVPPGVPPPDWFLPDMKRRWTEAQDGKAVNEYVRIYFWGCAHPHYEKVQGFPHHFNRVDWDETQQIHPGAYGIIRPMLRDVSGHELFTGTPWHTAIGNVQFEKWWDIAGDPTMHGWFRMRVPDGANPFVVAVTKNEMRTMTPQQISQTMYAKFLTGEGAVFSNLDNVLCLQPLSPDDEAVNWARELRSKYSVPTMRWWIHAPEPRAGHIYGASIDWARSPHGDYSVLSVFDFTTGRQAAVFRWRGVDFSAQMELVLGVQQHYGAAQLHSDSNGMGEAMADFLRRRHALGFVGHKFGKNKPKYVRSAQVLLEDGDVELIDFPEQRHEFKSFSAFESEGLGSEKQVKYCAPQGETDDIVASFLQLAPTLSIVGRQEAAKDDPLPPPMFDERRMTTLDLWAEGGKVPWDRQEADAEVSWNSIVLPQRYR